MNVHHREGTVGTAETITGEELDEGLSVVEESIAAVAAG
jgi:hypothetical protein